MESDQSTSPQGVENPGGNPKSSSFVGAEPVLDGRLTTKQVTELLKLTLQGVDIHKDRSQLCDVAIEVKTQVKFLPSLIQQTTAYIKSYCKQQVDAFNHALNHLGLSIDLSKVYSGLGDYNDGSSPAPLDTNFYHCSRHTTVPLYQCQLEKDCLSLSRGLLADLRALEVQVSNVKDENCLQSSCEKLFRKYGSHVYVGNIHFGEIYSWGAQFSGVKKDAATVKQAVEEAFAADVDPSSAHPKDVMVFRKIKGGQSNAASFDMRQRLLEDNNEEATLVDRGRDIVGIWEILLNHKDDFDNVENFSQMLKNAYDCRSDGNGCDTDSSVVKRALDPDKDFVFVDLPCTESIKEIGKKSNLSIKETHQTHPGLEGDAGHDYPHTALEEFDMFKHLDLEKYYPEKISISDVMTIGEFKEKDEIQIGDIPWIILQKIIMLDRQAVIGNIHRCAKVCQGHPQGNGNDDDKENNANKEDNNQDDDKVHEDSNDNDDGASLDSLTELSDLSGDKSQINPADVFLAIFSCCDLNLRQTIVEKMNQCRLAIPFLFPDRSGKKLTFSVWALRSTILSWRDASGIASEASAVNTPLKVISCLRLGRPQLSKSKLLNKVINDQVGETFLNVDSPNGDKQRLLSAGLVEASFFLPNGKRSDESDSLDDVTMFLNLRGDGTKYDMQLMMLSQLSDIVLVYVDIADLSNDSVHSKMRYIHQHCDKVILILSGGKSLPKAEIKKQLQVYKQKVGANPKKVFSFNSDGEKNASQLKSDVRKIIRDSSTRDEYSVLKDKILQLPFKVDVDEMSVYCQKGKKLADEVMSNIDGSPKSELLPLQQECWKGWCKLLKEKKRSKQASGDSTSMQAVGIIEQKMREYREKQEELCRNSNRFIESFIDRLTSEIDDPSIEFYMQWLEMHINDISRKALPPLQRKYHEILHKNKGMDRTSKACQKEILDIETEISNATMGIEHLMREMSQMYEAAVQSNDEELCRRFGNLPLLAAKLLLKGHALEIMDGDASGVPLVWVQAVFTVLEKILGDQKLLSLSVLGVQSSGKSTLLNTMFGLQFPVSAGRCTRGVYMQLIKVKEDSGLPFNYVAVLDSEGLRAAESGDSNYDHDNELATFVIGLGNVTLINIKGENVAEIKDILQIVSHAFLRMKMVNKHIQKDRSCVFVHQNVPALNAKEKMMRGAQKFQENLDQKTKEAAELEHIADIYSFDQVIKFDNQKHIWYFPDLWHGDPPMAAINNGYHQSIVSLKASLLQEQVEQSPLYFRLSEMKAFIGDMWNGVLADDFVFCFRNSLVMKAYSQLETKYSQLKYELEVSTIDWYRRIRLDECEPEANLHSLCENLKREAADVIRKQQEVLTKELDRFIESDSQKEIMVTWKQEKVFALQSAANTLCEKLRLDINEMKANHEVKMLKKKQQHNHKQEILTKAQRLAEDLKTTDEKILSCEFDKMWTEWIGNVYHEKAKVDIEGSVADLLYGLFPAHHAFLKSALESRPLNEFPILEGSFKKSEINKKDLKFTLYKTVQAKVFKCHKKKRISDVVVKINQIFRKVDTFLKKLSDGYNLENVEALLQIVIMEISTFNKIEKQSITMNKCLEIRLVTHVAKYFLQDPIKIRDLRPAILTLLHQFYPDQVAYLEQELSKGLQLSSLEGNIEEELLRDIHKRRSEAVSFFDKIFKDCDFQLNRLSGQDSGFQLLDAKKILQKGLLNKNPDLPVKFPNNIEVQLVVHIARYAMRVFHEVQDNYDQTYSATAQLEDYRRTTWNHFLHTVRQTEKEVIAVERMCDELEPSMRKHVKNSVQNAVFKEIVPHFFTKKKLIKLVLEDLAHKQSFQEHLGYVLNPKKFILSWIKKYTDDLIFRTQSQYSWYVNQAERFLTELVEDVVRSMDQASKETYQQKTISNLIKRFSEKLLDSSRSVALTSTNLPDIDQYEVKDFDYIVKLFVKHLRVVQEKELQYFKDETRQTLTWDGNTPYLQICDSLWGCEEVCPFCNEPCIRSNPDHASSGISHESIQHRPAGIALGHWEDTKKLVVGSCNFEVQTGASFRCSGTIHKCDRKTDPMATYHTFKEYKAYVADWDICPSPDMDSSNYWKWFFCTYKEEMMKEIDDGQEPDIPKSWYNITKLKAIESLFVYD